MNKPDPTELLNADNLADLEAHALTEGTEGVTYAPAVTLADAVEALRRIRYHKGRIADTQAEADALIAPLQAQIDQVKAWAFEQVTDRLHRIAVHESRLIAYYRSNPPPGKIKTIKLPGGRVSAKGQQPKWVYPEKVADEKVLLAELEAINPELVRTTKVPAKDAIKKAADVLEGGVVVVEGVVITRLKVLPPEPDTFTVEVE